MRQRNKEERKQQLYQQQLFLHYSKDAIIFEFFGRRNFLTGPHTVVATKVNMFYFPPVNLFKVASRQIRD